MTRETKVGLLVGLGIILLIGIIVSDHLSVARHQTPADFTHFADLTQKSLNAKPTPSAKETVGRGLSRPRSADQPAAVLTPKPLPLPARTPDTRPTQTYEVSPPQASPTRPTPTLSFTSQRTQQDAVPTLIQTQTSTQPYASSSAQPLQSYSEKQVTTSTMSAPLASTGNTQPIIHYVAEGESLWQIAQKYYDNGEYWRSLANSNPKAVGPNGQVRVGVRLVIPNKAGLANLNAPQANTQAPKPSSQTADRKPRPSPIRIYVVEPNDSLWTIAQATLGDGNRWEEIYEANRKRLTKPDAIQVGQKLTIPNP